MNEVPVSVLYDIKNVITKIIEDLGPVFDHDFESHVLSKARLYESRISALPEDILDLIRNRLDSM